MEGQTGRTVLSIVGRGAAHAELRVAWSPSESKGKLNVMEKLVWI